jgi:hypothetical protein
MNNVCHIEIPSKDFAKAKKFYGDVFSWTFQDIPEMNYLIYKAPDGIGGGFSKEAEFSSKPGILLYIEVENMEGSIKKAEQAGGATVKGKTQISPDMGYYAMVKDLEGNVIGLWSKN